MIEIIRLNGHLLLDGDETVQELRDALIFLTDHPSTMCKWPEYAIPIERLIPDITVLRETKKPGPKPGKSRRVVNVDISNENL